MCTAQRAASVPPQPALTSAHAAGNALQLGQPPVERGLAALKAGADAAAAARLLATHAKAGGAALQQGGEEGWSASGLGLEGSRQAAASTQLHIMGAAGSASARAAAEPGTTPATHLAGAVAATLPVLGLLGAGLRGQVEQAQALLLRLGGRRCRLANDRQRRAGGRPRHEAPRLQLLAAEGGGHAGRGDLRRGGEAGGVRGVGRAGPAAPRRLQCAGARGMLDDAAPFGRRGWLAGGAGGRPANLHGRQRAHPVPSLLHHLTSHALPTMPPLVGRLQLDGAERAWRMGWQGALQLHAALQRHCTSSLLIEQRPAGPAGSPKPLATSPRAPRPRSPLALPSDRAAQAPAP